MDAPLTRRLAERRTDNPNIVPIREQRDGDDRREREPRWLTWTRANESRGKDLGAGRAA